MTTTRTIEEAIQQESTETLEYYLSIYLGKDKQAEFDIIMHYNLCGVDTDYIDIIEIIAKIKTELLPRIRNRRLESLGL